MKFELRLLKPTEKCLSNNNFLSGPVWLAAFSAQKRQKEMSIRKVVGASTTDFAALLSKDFFRLILVAILISFPLSWRAMNL